MKETKAIIAIVVGTLILSSCGKAPTYVEFTSKDSNYFNEVAKACDELLTKNRVSDDSELSIPLNDPSLPPAIKELSPTEVLVRSNRVFLMVGFATRPGFGLAWETEGGVSWELWAHADGASKFLLRSNRPSVYPNLEQ